MSNVGFQVIQSMYKHLVQSYDPAEAREILVQKYPEQEGDILTLQYEVVQSESADETETEQLASAVKQKVAKPAKPAKVAKVKAPKVAKPAKVKTETKMDKARALYEAASDKSRKAMIELFGKELGMSAAASSTYFYNIKG